MMHPLNALLLTSGALALAVVLFWPVRGVFWKAWLRVRASDRVLIEDALKHLYDCEYREVPATVHSVAGALGLSANRAAGFVARLEHLELVAGTEGTYRLTPEGRSYALRVIRIHRLWERYLSEETGLGPREWHVEAERREHRTSAEQAEALAEQLGNPRFDPHGDPIPTASGDIPPREGIPLTELPVGQAADILHVEDEPAAVYAQIVAAGLHPGMRVRVIEASPQRIRFESDAEEHVLAPVVAASLSVAPIPAEQEAPGPFARLSSLRKGERARVVGLSRVCRGVERRRLLDLGIVPGTEVLAEFRSPTGDPTAYRIRGAVIALRREQADLIHVDPPVGEEAPA